MNIRSSLCMSNLTQMVTTYSSKEDVVGSHNIIKINLKPTGRRGSPWVVVGSGFSGLLVQLIGLDLCLLGNSHNLQRSLAK